MSAQSGEDRILLRLLSRIGTTNRVAVEFGAKDGVCHSNTAALRERGWTCHLFDAHPAAPMVTRAFLTRENINAIFAQAGIPTVFDVLSIDVDGNDLWLWDALTYQPRILVIEYNPSFATSVSVTVPYEADRTWDGTVYFGASVLALYRLARRKGYRLAHYTRSNLIFVQKSLMSTGLRPWSVRGVPRLVKPPDPHRRPWVQYR